MNLLFIPGRGVPPEHYHETFAAIEQRSLTVTPIAPNWKETLQLADLRQAVTEEVRRELSPETIVVGHSVGADLGLFAVAEICRQTTSQDNLPAGLVLTFA